MRIRLRWLLVFTAFAAVGAQAHTELGVAGGLLSGLVHPVQGVDHLVAMVAVGLWGAQLRQPAIWLLPVTFPLVMAFGGVLGMAGVPLPNIELGIATSGLLLGVMVAFSCRPPLAAAALLVGCFGIFHGHAHGTELPAAANPLAYGLGFVIATGFLHACGIAFGELVRWPLGRSLVRCAGGLVALCGGYFLAGALGVLS